MTTTLTEAPTTGLRYDTGKLQWHLMDYRAMEPMIQVLMYGAKKYTVELEDGTVVPGDHNWKKGMALEKILDCLQRHVAALMAGEVQDPESGLPHIGHVLCNAMFYSHFEQKKVLKDTMEQMVTDFMQARFDNIDPNVSVTAQKNVVGDALTTYKSVCKEGERIGELKYHKNQ